MELIPVNRYLVVEYVEDTKEEENTTILLPEDVKIKNLPYSVVKLLRGGDGAYELGSLLVINSNMVEEVTFEGQTYYLLLENYVIGYLGQD